jgi:integrase
LSAPRQPRDRAFLMTIYACGLRLAEARYLKTTDIDRARMQLRVCKGKGSKERVLPLSNRLLKELVDYWHAQRQGEWGHDIPWLFLGYRAEPICTVPSYGWWLLSALGVGAAALAIRQVVPTGVNVIGLQLGFFASYIFLFCLGIAA